MAVVKKNYTVVQPEVIVGLGEHTIFDTEVPVKGQKRKVISLHIQLEDWLGDDLMECHPCYIVTEKLKNALVQSDYTGFVIDALELTKDEYFFSNYNLKKVLEPFYWLKINDNKKGPDIFVDETSHLNISQSLLAFLKKSFSVQYMDINPERDEFDDLLDDMLK